MEGCRFEKYKSIEQGTSIADKENSLKERCRFEKQNHEVYPRFEKYIMSKVHNFLINLFNLANLFIVLHFF